MQTHKRLKILVVDDSAIFRGILTKSISSDPELEVIASAVDPFDARDKIIEYEPDIMVCDVVMPKMDGIEFIRKLLPQYPLRVVVISSVSESVLDAMSAGAIDFVAKPDLSLGRTKDVFLTELISKIKIAATANISRPKAETVTNRRTINSSTTDKKIIAIGASTGGTEALFNILKQLPPTLPGIVIVQHIPPVFSRMFAERMNKSTQLNVKEAENGDIIENGIVLIAPGDKHLTVRKNGNILRVDVSEGEKVSGHCPSVDVLFESVARTCGKNAVGIILTGMGRDGARGLLAMRENGARTIGQDEASCVVYGMPKTAFEIGAVEIQVPLNTIPQSISSALSN